MINAETIQVINKLNKLTNNWLDDAKKQIKLNGINIVSNNQEQYIQLKNEVVEATPIYNDEVNAKIAKLEMQIKKLKQEATPINQGEITIKQTVYIKKITKNAQKQLDILLNDSINNIDNNVKKAIETMISNL